jgi:hypothetical protein
MVQCQAALHPAGPAANPSELCYGSKFSAGGFMTEAEPRSIFDMEPDAAHEARLDAEAEADCAAGRVVPHERVREWFAELVKGERIPPPEA